MRIIALVLLLAAFTTAATALTGVTGATGSGKECFAPRETDLYSESPPLLVTGNEVSGAVLAFHPKGDVNAGLCDTDNDGVRETKINDFRSFANAANNIFNEEVAACVVHAPGDRRIYENPAIWTDDGGGSTLHLRPDTMPEYADGMGSPSTGATQFIQFELPFDVDPASVYSGHAPPSVDYLTRNIVIHDETGRHVACTALVDGKDVFGRNRYTTSPHWPKGATAAPDVIVLIAQTEPGRAGRPDAGYEGIEPNVALTGTPGVPGRWTAREVYVHIGSLQSLSGKKHEINSRSMVRRTGVDVTDNATSIRVIRGEASATVANPVTGGNLEDHWPGVPAGENTFVPTNATFVVTFNKPVVPVSVGRSIVFNRAPFTGNMNPVVNIESLQWPPNPACALPIMPLCNNLSLRAYFLDSTGVPLSRGSPVPFRVRPTNQNNLAEYIVTPLIDLPGSSSDWSGDLPGEPPTPPPYEIRMRIKLSVHDYLQNVVSGDPGRSHGAPTPQNTGVAGFHGERFHMGGIKAVSKTFSVRRGTRCVNAPVSPNVLYFTMQSGGIGALDLDGTGMVTNAPGDGRSILVTNTPNYKEYGNSSMGDGNAYMYQVGLGHNSPVPGVNAGSSGWWRDLDPSKNAFVRDSNGENQLFPAPGKGVASSRITDIEVGDFLDTLYFDKENRYNPTSLHLDYVFHQAAGNFPNNTIGSPPTPNPPPLSLPVGMRPPGVIIDEYGILPSGAFTILGREVFPPDLRYLQLEGPFQWVHLEHGFAANPPQYPDKPFPPVPPGPALPWSQGSYIQNGPLAETCTFYQAHGFPGASYGSRQQIGNFLFAADSFRNVVHVVNSNTMEEITTLNGVRHPDRLALTPDLKNLYVTNNAADTVSVFDVDPRSTTFLQQTSEIPVGSRPKGISCQPEMEDIHVCNFGSDSISIIEVRTSTVRKTLTRFLKNPIDVVLTPRQQNFGWGTQTYFGYISNHGADNILIYESGPDGLGGVGYDDILDEVPLAGQGGKVYEKIVKPRGLCYDPLYLDNVPNSLNLVGGAFVAHTSAKGVAVSRIQFAYQPPPWGPRFLPSGTPPNFRDRKFLITAQWTSQAGFLSGSGSAVDVALPDLNRRAWLNETFSANPYVTNYGAVGNNPIHTYPNNNKHPLRILSGVPQPVFDPDLIFVTYSGSNNLDVLDIVNGTTSTITGLQRPASRITSYFK